MEVTEVKLYKSKKDGIVKAFGKATVGNELTLDVLIMDKNDGKGPWATFPNGKTGSDGKYYLPVFWKTKELDQAFKAKVIEGYHAQVPSGGSTPVPAPVPSATPAQGDLPF
jgi:DNA-binding cell septation regulator SpoVG